MTVEILSFNPVFPPWATVAVAVIISALFIYKEIQRARQFVTLRIAMQILITVSLLGLALRPSYKGEAASTSVLLLTKGYDKTKADSLKKVFSLRVVRTQQADGYADSKVISSWHQLSEYAAGVKYVLGEGIPPYALDEFEDLHFDFISSSQPEGVVKLESKQLKVNASNMLSGEFRSRDNETLLQLNGPGGIEDSVQLNGNGILQFSLKTKPKQSGKFIYQLITKDKGKIIQQENLPLEVFPEKKLKILFIQQYPTFETRHIKNYLSEKGHTVIVRYQVSKNAFRYEYANGERVSIPVISSSLLSSFDLLVMSPEALTSFSLGERQAFETSLKEGLGVLLLFSQPPAKQLQTIFPITTISIKSDTVKFTVPNGLEKFTLPAVPIRASSSPVVHSIISDHNKNIVSGYFNNHLGKIGFQFLNETYRLALEGKSDEYARLWSPLIDAIARTERDEFKITITSPFPLYEDQPVQVNVISAEKAPELFMDRIRVPMKEDVTIDNFWHSTVWVSKTGWHQFSLQDSTQLNFYVSDDNEWSTLNLSNQITRNKIYQSLPSANQPVSLAYKPISPLLFFLLFLFSSGTLWLLAKL
jgi:hypothetical protein